MPNSVSPAQEREIEEKSGLNDDAPKADAAGGGDEEAAEANGSDDEEKEAGDDGARAADGMCGLGNTVHAKAGPREGETTGVIEDGSAAISHKSCGIAARSSSSFT
jgi:hypothetical protein